MSADAQEVYNRKVAVAKTRRDKLIQAAKDEYTKEVRQAVDELHASTGQTRYFPHA